MDNNPLFEDMENYYGFQSWFLKSYPDFDSGENRCLGFENEEVEKMMFEAWKAGKFSK